MGMLVGAADGSVVGLSVGMFVGLAEVGASVGTLDGLAVVGTSVGAFDGSAVVGMPVGTFVGLDEEEVGASVGIALDGRAVEDSLVGISTGRICSGPEVGPCFFVRGLVVAPSHAKSELHHMLLCSSPMPWRSLGRCK